MAEFTTKFAKPYGQKPFKRFRDVPANGDLYYQNFMGGEVIVKSATNPHSLVAEAVDSVLLAEAAQLDQEVWERYCRPRLVTKQGFATFATTPYMAGRWLYELEMRTADLEEWAVFHQAAWDCAHYPPGEVEKARQDLSEDAFYEQIGGEWRYAGGTVYNVFKPDIHLVDPFSVSPSLPLF